jgi:hypothetical protein
VNNVLPLDLVCPFSYAFQSISAKSPNKSETKLGIHVILNVIADIYTGNHHHFKHILQTIPVLTLSLTEIPIAFPVGSIIQ